MMFRVAALSAVLASVVSATTLRPGASLSASSKAGQSLLSKARALNEDRDVTWVANYDIKYTGCSSLVQVREEGGGGDESLLYTQNMVKFTLCPSTGSSCSASCSGGGEYVVSMMEFVNAYTEFKMNAKEQMCENIRENCYCGNANDDEACENQCYVNAGLEDCIEYEGDEEFEIQKYLECAEMEDNNNNNNGNYNYNNNGGNNWYGQYFVGPYCSESDGYSIHLGVFYDEGCSSRASASVYADKNYGAELPFSSEPIVDGDCISCLQVDDNNNNNNNYNYNYNLETNELCDGVYELAARCESNMDIQYKDTAGCDYIQRILPRLDKATRNISSKSSGSSGGGAAVAFAWIFAITTIAFGGYAFFLYRKLSRNKVNLSGSDGALA